MNIADQYELVKRVGEFEYVVSLDEDFCLTYYNQYAPTAEEANKTADKFDSGELQAYVVTKYSICAHCNQRDQIIDSLCGMVSDTADHAMGQYLVYYSEEIK